MFNQPLRSLCTLLLIQLFNRSTKEETLKKKVYVLLALILVLAIVSGACSKPAEPSAPAAESTPESQEEPTTSEEPVSLTVQAETAWVPHYEKAIDRVLSVYPNADITIIETGAFDHLNVIDATDATNVDVADVFALPADRIYGLSNSEVLAGIDSPALAADLGGFADFDAGLGGNFKIDGEYLAFPYNIETLISFVNVANAEAEGIDHTAPFELNDVTKPEPVLLPAFDAWFGVALTNSAEIELLGKDESGALFSDMTKEWAELEPEKQAAIESLYNYWKVQYDNNTPLFDPEAGWGFIDDTFATGGSGVIRIDGPWGTAGISEQAGNGADLEIYPLSQITVAGKPLTHWKGGWGLGINSRIEEDAPKMEVAHALIKEIVNPEYAVDLFKATGKILENVTAEAYAESDLSDVDKKVIASVIASYEEAPARPLFTEWGSVWDTWKNSILSWNAQTPESPEEAYKEIKASFDAMMSNF